MINFMELGTTTFEEGIAGGMEPEREPKEPQEVEQGVPDMDSVTQAMDGEVDAPMMPNVPDMNNGGTDDIDVTQDETSDEIV